MAETLLISCDNCNRTKDSKNGWFIYWINPLSQEFIVQKRESAFLYFVLAPSTFVNSISAAEMLMVIEKSKVKKENGWVKKDICTDPNCRKAIENRIIEGTLS